MASQERWLQIFNNGKQTSTPTKKKKQFDDYSEIVHSKKKKEKGIVLSLFIFF